MDIDAIIETLLLAHVPSMAISAELRGTSQKRVHDIRRALGIEPRIGKPPTAPGSMSHPGARLEAGLLLRNYGLVRRDADRDRWVHVDLLAMVAVIESMAQSAIGQGGGGLLWQHLTVDRSYALTKELELGRVEWHRCQTRLPGETTKRCSRIYAVLDQVYPQPSCCPQCEDPSIIPSTIGPVRLRKRTAKRPSSSAASSA